MTPWQAPGDPGAEALIEARLQLHQAVQIVASAGATWLEPEPDDSHPNLGWDAANGAWLGRALSPAGLRFGLRARDLTLYSVETRGRVGASRALAGETLDAGYAWLEETARTCGLALPAEGLRRVTYEIPAHPVGEGAPFSLDAAPGFGALSDWFSSAFARLVPISERVSASEVRVWPHHFDAGSLRTVATDAEGRLQKSIGLGFSPGDDTDATPYFYVSPWPYPAASDLPTLEIGRWHTDGFVAAVLGAGEVLAAGGAADQSAFVQRFLEDAYAASERVLAD